MRQTGTEDGNRTRAKHEEGRPIEELRERGRRRREVKIEAGEEVQWRQRRSQVASKERRIRE